ncbi:serologically defined colon cancer antigen 8 homolog [Venturia canescens]|uniref:serologically defined colon cancer antigen 8 homolog n=1 Tax=Venturia canescens TaxID=32260 RepID=UPI001C9CC3B4|nr:serologically defined colon cancer antigen 8 homolog [Venturia canescens]
MNNYSRRYRLPSNPATNFTNTAPSTILSRPRLPLRTYMKPKNSYNLASLDPSAFCRSKRFKSRKISGCQKIDVVKKKTPDYTENAYREAVSKLKYLLAETYAPRLLTGKPSRDRVIYRRSNLRINETPEDSDDRSVSDCSRAKAFPGNQFEDDNACSTTEKNRRLVATSQNSVAYPARDIQSSPSELTSFIARQEEYIEQLEQESRYCKDELKNLLEKIREVVAENEALHDKNKAGLLKSFLREYDSFEENKKPETENQGTLDSGSNSGKKVRIHQRLEGPNIVFESRISELEAQLTQARIELKKAREDNETYSKRLAENSGNQASPEFVVQLENALREKHELSVKLDEALRSLQAMRDRENESTQRAKRATNLAQQSDFDKYQADAEIRRLNDELDRQREKLREIAQETSRRVAEERHQVERRYSQQVEQLSADVASHWDAASKSQMETEKQRRELLDLKRDLGQKQMMIDDLKKELQNKIANLQSDLNQAIAEKDAADQEIAAAKLTAERSERHLRQEQSRWQAEINSYKQRLERADADIVHCRRENLRLSEQIASLEKEVNMTKLLNPPESQPPVGTPRPEGEKDLTTMIMDIETKHAATVTGLEDVLSNQAKLVARLTAECQSLTHRLEANDRTHKEEMASLQSNLEYLSTKIHDTLENKKEAEHAAIFDRENTQHNNENNAKDPQVPGPNEYPDSEYPQISNDNSNNTQVEGSQNYMGNEEKYEAQEYPVDNENYSTDYNDQGYDQYGQYDPSMYPENSNNEPTGQQPAEGNLPYEQNQQQYEDYPTESYTDNTHQQISSADNQQEYEQSSVPTDSNNSQG